MTTNVKKQIADFTKRLNAVKKQMADLQAQQAMLTSSIARARIEELQAEYTEGEFSLVIVYAAGSVAATEFKATFKNIKSVKDAIALHKRLVARKMGVIAGNPTILHQRKKAAVYTTEPVKGTVPPFKKAGWYYTNEVYAK